MRLILVVILLTACSYKNEPSKALVTLSNDDFLITEEPKEHSVNLSWDIPTERENGEPLYIYEIGGYEIRHRTGSEYEYLYINDGSTENLTITNLEPLKYYFSISAYDIDGLYSEYSNEVNIVLGQ